MSFNLSKNQPFDLNKAAPGLRHVFLGLGWDPVKAQQSGGFLGRMFGGGEAESIDLDASCLVFDARKNHIDTVWFRNLSSDNGAIEHSGDNLTGEGDGDDEVIRVDLSALPASAQTLVFTINSFRGQTFEKVASAKCRIVNEDNGKELAAFVLSEKHSHTGVLMAKLYRNGGSWVMEALGVPQNGRTAQDMAAACQAHI